MNPSKYKNSSNVALPLSITNGDGGVQEERTPEPYAPPSDISVGGISSSENNELDIDTSSAEVNISSENELDQQLPVSFVENVLSNSNSSPKNQSGQVLMSSVFNSTAIKRPKIFPCPRCNKKFAQYTSSVKHCLSQVSKEATCSKCYKKMDKRNLKRHMKVHENVQANVLVVCDTCNITFSSKQKLECHLVTKHRISKPVSVETNRFECTECDFVHSKESVVKRHMTNVHSNNVRIHCDKCEYSCVSKSALYKHQAKVHKSVENSVTNHSEIRESDDSEKEPFSSNTLPSENPGFVNSSNSVVDSISVGTFESPNNSLLPINGSTFNQIGYDNSIATPHSYSASVSERNSGGDGHLQSSRGEFVYSNQLYQNSLMYLPAAQVYPWQACFNNRIYNNPEYGLYSHQINVNYSSVSSRVVDSNNGSEYIRL